MAYVTPLPQVLYHSFISGFGAQRDELTGGGGSTGGGMWDAQIHGRRFFADLVAGQVLECCLKLTICNG